MLTCLAYVIQYEVICELKENEFNTATLSDMHGSW